jgi:non-ribosomal peptide synthetase component F
VSANGARLRVDAPKGALNEKLRQRIAARKDALLDLLRQGEATPKLAMATIPRSRADRPAPLSFAQERLWFVQQLAPGDAVFHLCRATRLRGALNVAALEQSFNGILQRHEALRSKFFTVDAHAVQQTAEFERLVLRVVDLRRLPAQRRERASQRVVDALARQPFDLSRGHLLRAQLVRLGDKEYLLFYGTHHMVADAWSMGILSNEIWSLYETYANGAPPSLAELPIQYRDYALWQRAELARAETEAHLAYWRKQLADPPTLDLPTDHARPVRQSFRGARVPIVLDERLTKALSDLSRRENATLFMTLLAAFYLLLHRYTGQRDILVGTPVANRERREFEAVIGLFVNAVPLRAGFSGEPSFIEWLHRVRETCLDGFAHQDVPFEWIVEALKPARERNRHPLFQTMFVLQNTVRRGSTLSDIVLQSVEVDTHSAQFDLALYLRQRDGKLLGHFEYCRDLFQQSTIERMAGHFATLLQSVAAAPAQSMATLPMLGEVEQRQLLVEWNATKAEFPAEGCIHGLFEERVERSPDAIALEFAGAEITYRELNRRANQLAHYLIALNAASPALVAICVERSIETVVGLLAILKAGAAYVPLDPGYPKERLKIMLEDSRAAILITKEKWLEHREWTAVPSEIEGMKDRDHRSSTLDPALKVVCLDRDWPAIEKVGANNPSTGGRAAAAAYVIYTSGSTGTPKGVVALHRGALNRFNWMWRQYPFAPGEVCCMKTSLSFVDSVWEIFGPLLQGIRLVIASDETASDPHRLVVFLAEHRITRIVLVPSLLQALLDDTPNLQKKLPQLVYWTSSGEALPAPLAARFKKSHPRATLLNLYGSSEVGADVTCYEYRHVTSPSYVKGGKGGIFKTTRKQIPLSPRFSKGEDSDGRSGCGTRSRAGVPIGRPIANTEIYLLDAHMQPVPNGVTGELFVGGAGLARGYWNRPELTAERFVANPFNRDPTARLFRTGDFARYWPDGNLEFLGRADRQIKVRGQRIELAEIEAALRTHREIQDCVVAALGEEPRGSADARWQIPDYQSNGSLCAYVVFKQAAELSVSGLREFLRRRLSEAMTPSHFVILDHLPLLPNGKVDRRALPAPTHPSTSEMVEPRTALEQGVAAIWRELLRLERVGVDDDFFALGGHSLLATQLTARLRAAFAVELSLRDLFDAPTIAGVAGTIESALRQGNGDDLPPIPARSLAGHLPLSMAQEQFFILDELLSGAEFLHLPYGYRLTGTLDLAALRRSLQTIVDRHAVLRTVFRDLDGAPAQTIRRSQKLVCSLVDLSALGAGQRQAALARLSSDDANAPFDLTARPAFRVKLIRLAPREHVLLVTLHHIIGDQWSLRRFRYELTKLYEAFARGLPSPLADLPIQFADFTRWQNQLLETGGFDEQFKYWRNILAGAAPRLELTGARRQRARSGYRSAAKFITLDGALCTGVRELARRLKLTPFVVLLAALDAWLWRLTGSRDIRIATLVANRSRPHTEELIGYLVNAVVLRAQIAPRMSFIELLDQARATALGAFAHQDLPIEALARALQNKQNSANRSFYQVMMNYRRFEFQSETVSGLTIASLGGTDRAAAPDVAFTSADLSFDFRETSTALTASVNYKVALFDESFVEHALKQFSDMLAQAVALPEGKLSNIKLTPWNKRQVVKTGECPNG